MLGVDNHGVRLYTLHIANKNYSSWSLRPWILCHANGIPFQEELHPLHAREQELPIFEEVSPSGKVPYLDDEGWGIWDSLAITEYLAERHPGIWPEDAWARAWARCVVAEVHSGFQSLRSLHSMNIGIRVKVGQRPLALIRDYERVERIWWDALSRFGGPYLMGSTFSAVDAFFAPFVFRFQTYNVRLNNTSEEYRDFLLRHPSMQRWQADALAETMREAEHDAECERIGTIVEDFRARGEG